jgi:hypothetical protein
MIESSRRHGPFDPRYPPRCDGGTRPPAKPSGTATGLAGQEPLAFEVYLGSFGGPSYGVWWDGSRLVYESFEPAYDESQQVLLSPSRAQWERFWRSMNEIGVWQWAARYEPAERFEPLGVVRDGTHWSVTLAWAGGKVESSGDTAGPNSRDLDESRDFGRFCDAVSRLLGSREFS